MHNPRHATLTDPDIDLAHALINIPTTALSIQHPTTSSQLLTTPRRTLGKHNNTIDLDPPLFGKISKMLPPKFWNDLGLTEPFTTSKYDQEMPGKITEPVVVVAIVVMLILSLVFLGLDDNLTWLARERGEDPEEEEDDWFRQFLVNIGFDMEAWLGRLMWNNVGVGRE